MVDVLGKLIFEKLIFATCIGPARVLLLNIPKVRAAREWASRKVLRKPEYTVGATLMLIACVFSLLPAR